MRVSLFLFCVLPLGSSIAAQTPTPTDLRATIVAADSALFTAYNQRDLSKLQSFFTPDLEFYQDNEGVEDYTQTMKDFGQMFRQPSPIHRDLVPGSLEVYPIKNYGAMEVGRHRFCHVENGKDDCGTFSFVHIWRQTKTGWKISRVISYGHR
ncbi:MAG TPA: nuclear transport factor 2 family protein [Gemmatimonadaceae bacterium]|jgi:ketosteroid isomerase-like protein